MTTRARPDAVAAALALLPARARGWVSSRWVSSRAVGPDELS